MEQFRNALADAFGENALFDEPMARHTTFKVGGLADACVFPGSAAEIALALDIAERFSEPCVTVGNGSNLIVRDGGVRGLVVILGERLSRIEVSGARIFAEAGAPLSKVAWTAMRHGLSGLEFASGIPGTLGGGVAMNAGAYGGQMSDVLVSAKALSRGKIVEYSNAEMEMGYRSTRSLREGSIVLSAVFELLSGDTAVISAKMNELNARRRDKQPLNFPSAGSVFKRPEGYFAGALIEGAGLKGARVGGAAVSEKHAGFIVNAGGATAKDIEDLIRLVQSAVYDKYAVELETEVRIIGEA